MPRPFARGRNGGEQVTAPTWPVPMPALTSSDPTHVHNRPFAVDAHHTGTLAPHVAAFRAIHVEAWLRETDLATVLQTWQAVQRER